MIWKSVELEWCEHPSLNVCSSAPTNSDDDWVREREREFRRRGRARSVGTTGQSDGADRKFIRTILNQPRDSCCVLQGRKFTRRISRPPPLRLPSPLGSKREEKGMEKIEKKRKAILRDIATGNETFKWHFVGGFQVFSYFSFLYFTISVSVASRKWKKHICVQLTFKKVGKQ